MKACLTEAPNDRYPRILPNRTDIQWHDLESLLMGRTFVGFVILAGQQVPP